MKKIYSYNQTININGKDYGKASIFNKYFLSDEEKKDTPIKYESFEKLYNDVEKGKIINAYCGTTFFKKRRAVKFSTETTDMPITITEKNFQYVGIGKLYKDVTDIFTIRELSDILTADEFCDFLKDRKVFEIKDAFI